MHSEFATQRGARISYCIRSDPNQSQGITWKLLGDLRLGGARSGRGRTASGRRRLAGAGRRGPESYLSGPTPGWASAAATSRPTIRMSMGCWRLRQVSPWLFEPGGRCGCVAISRCRWSSRPVLRALARSRLPCTPPATGAGAAAFFPCVFSRCPGFSRCPSLPAAGGGRFGGVPLSAISASSARR